MRKTSSARPMLLVLRACNVSNNRLNVLLVFVALALCIATEVPAKGGGGPESTHTIAVGTGWNLLSLPANVSNGSKAFLFPSAVSPAFVFDSAAGYTAHDTLENGVGFWMKFDSAQTVVVEGQVVVKDTIEVQAGWNLIGALSLPVAVDSMQTNPPDMITAQVYGYEPGRGYQQVDTLYPGLGYWVKANQGGTILLASPGGLPCPGIPTVLYAGKTYNTVQLGSQCWLRENLDIGTMILGSANQTNNSIIEKYCYDNNPSNCDTFGGLYQWYEAMQYSITPGVQGICPPGWHMPTLAELETLSTTVGGDGNALKAIGQGSGGGAGTNTSGFSVLLAGYRYYDGYFYGLGVGANFWSSSQYGATSARNLHLYYDDGGISLNYGSKYCGFSARCLKDDPPNRPPNAPSNPTPLDSSTEQSISLILSWSCGDPDGDPLTYDVYFGTDNPPDTLVSSNQTDTSMTRSGLTGGTAYYWKVVAKDNHGDSTAGPMWLFTTAPMGFPCPATPTVDYAGKIYNTVQIGSQCWLRENLDVGTMINGTLEQTDNDTIEKYCYDNNPVNCDTFGGLYQWDEAMQYRTTPGAQGVCPPGWHIPTLAEYDTLSATVGGDGNALKAIGQGSGGGAGTNMSGFSALLAGSRENDGAFYDLGNHAYVWSSSMDGWWWWGPHSLVLFYSDGGIALNPSSTDIGFSVRCLKGDAPSLLPDAPSNPTPPDGSTWQSTSLTLSWSCSDPDGDPLTYDVYFGTHSPPDTVVSSNQTGTSLSRFGLTGGTTYYWKVVATDDDSNSTSGPVWSFATTTMGFPCPGTPTVVYAGKTYNTVQIVSQCWLRENLDVGTMINGTLNQTNNDTSEKYCYDNNPANCDTFGGLYQWDEAMQYGTAPGIQGICPPGWHLPTLPEFDTLSAAVGGDANALKAIGQGSDVGAGTNTSGFSALLAGYRRYSGGFNSLGYYAGVWSSTENYAAAAHHLVLYGYNAAIYVGYDYKYYGFSVRCLKD